MATLYIGHRLIASNANDAAKKGVKELQILWEKISAGLLDIEKDCQVKFPDLCFEIEELDLANVGVDLVYENKDEKIWELCANVCIKTTHPDEIPECDYEFCAISRWKQIGEPTQNEIYEPLYECDWTTIKPLISGSLETIADNVSVCFTGIYVDAYSEIHDREHWL
jgi:hypothetical protein